MEMLQEQSTYRGSQKMTDSQISLKNHLVLNGRRIEQN
jgi:hypothetical protein